MRYDLIIVGGGLVGTSLAVSLRQSGLTIALINARPPSNDDPRLFGLSQTSCQFLENLDIWNELALHATPIHAVHVSHRGRFGAVRLTREDASLSSLGHVIPARLIEEILHQRMVENANISLYCPATLLSLEQNASEVVVHLDTASGRQMLTAPIVIGADGAASRVRSELRISAEVVDYQQSAIVTKTLLARSHHHVAYERFNEHGAIAMLPLPRNECATIWTSHTDDITRLMSMPEDAFLEALQTAFGYRLGRFRSISQRDTFPLCMTKAEKTVEQKVLLIGNAAHTLHPVAAQGFNLALYEVAAISEAILEKQGEQPLSAADLQRISDVTQRQRTMSVGLSHHLTQLFSTRSLVAGLFLQMGMTGLDMIPPLKKTFLNTMLGRVKSTPRLLLGGVHG